MAYGVGLLRQEVTRLGHINLKEQNRTAARAPPGKALAMQV